MCCVVLFPQSFPPSLNYKCGYIENLESGAMVNIMVAVKAMAISSIHSHNIETVVKLRQGSGKDGQGMVTKAKGLKA